MNSFISIFVFFFNTHRDLHNFHSIFQWEKYWMKEIIIVVMSILFHFNRDFSIKVFFFFLANILASIKFWIIACNFQYAIQLLLLLLPEYGYMLLQTILLVPSIFTYRHVVHDSFQFQLNVNYIFDYTHTCTEKKAPTGDYVAISVR